MRQKSKSSLFFSGVLSMILLIILGFINPPDKPAYEAEIKAWHQKRIENLKKEDGWLNLAGLFWLNEGKNTFGAGRENQIVFPGGTPHDFLGTLTLNKGEVFLETTPDKAVYLHNDIVTNLKVFPAEQSIILKHQSLRWFVIKRGEKYGVRLRNLDSPFLKDFKGIETFPIDEKWMIKARLVKEENKKIPVTDVLGQTSMVESPGRVVFNILGKEYSLDALAEGSSLFIIFADATNKKETYGAGRFLYADMPDEYGTVYLDFNKAINPPCAFTPYATCPLPPKQNRLTIAIKAGEKNYGGH